MYINYIANRALHNFHRHIISSDMASGNKTLMKPDFDIFCVHPSSSVVVYAINMIVSITFYFNFAEIQTVPTSVQNLTRMRTLDLSSNPISA